MYGTDRRAVDHITLLKEIQTSVKRWARVFTHGWSSGVTNWRRIGWEGRVARRGEMRNGYRIYVGKRAGK
jgi:hypothetical protein